MFLRIIGAWLIAPFEEYSHNSFKSLVCLGFISAKAGALRNNKPSSQNKNPRSKTIQSDGCMAGLEIIII
jgi:hypothetical protein